MYAWIKQIAISNRIYPALSKMNSAVESREEVMAAAA